MSTATLLFVSTWLRTIAPADRCPHPASSVALSGRSRVTRSIAAMSLNGFTTLFQRLRVGIRSLRFPFARLTVRPLACASARLLLSRARVFSLGGLLALVPAGSTQAQSPPELASPEAAPSTQGGEASGAREPVRIGGEAPATPCVEVEVAGYKAGHLDCATRRLTEAARIAREQARAGMDMPVPEAGSPDVQVGVANQTATRLRMGDALGRSVNPERPNRPPAGPRR